MAAAASSVSGGGARGATPMIECQHPVTTGVYVYNLTHLAVKPACAAALELWRWEAKPGNLARLQVCGSRTRKPTLRLDSFEGWRISLTAKGQFQLARQTSSFDLTGTDFPLPCL
jgi:hypothetical protein